MTIEVALSGLFMSLFFTLITLILVGVSIISGTALLYLFIKALSWLLKITKGGIENLKDNVKAMSKEVITNN